MLGEELLGYNNAALKLGGWVIQMMAVKCRKRLILFSLDM